MNLWKLWKITFKSISRSDKLLEKLYKEQFQGEVGKGLELRLLKSYVR